MFKENTTHLQSDMFDFVTSLDAKMRKEIHESEEWLFYTMVFSKVREADFECLYSTQKSRPNAPINAMVSAYFLMHRNGWTFRELLKRIRFDMLTKVALGLPSLDEMPFSYATLFNFLKRLSAHHATTGCNLLETVFDGFTEDQLKTLQVKTTIQRTDSFQAESNIRRFSRLSLLVEMMIRVHRILSDEDKEKYADLFAPYVGGSASNYCYDVPSGALTTELTALGAAFQRIHTAIAPHYCAEEVMQVFARVFAEQFIMVADTVTVRDVSEITSASLQSPDDVDATYRLKRGASYHGHVVNVVETAHPENQVQLITDVAVAANNLDDSTILTDRLENVHEKTPDIIELHHDGAYGSETNDTLCASFGITPIQTGIRGRKPGGVTIEIEKTASGAYGVRCPMQTASVRWAKKRWKAEFSLEGCAGCVHESKCQVEKQIHVRAYYFTEEEYLKRRRFRNIDLIPEERRTLRANGEATMNEFVCKTKCGKLRVRGAFRTMLFAFSMAVSINFGRIYRYIRAKITDPSTSFSLHGIFWLALCAMRLVLRKTVREPRVSHHFRIFAYDYALRSGSGF